MSDIASKYLYSITSSNVKHDLNYITNFLELIGNPHLDFKTIHIAGTNGKGSVANYINYFLCYNDCKCGLFTSPHLVSITERIKVCSKDINKDQFINYVNKLDEIIKTNKLEKPTFFEALFLIAMKYFSDNNIEYAILETGIGGLCDVTNVDTNKILNVVTNIGYDHENILGNTLEKITLQKIGIARKNIPLVYLNNNRTVSSVIKKDAKNKNYKIYAVNGRKKYTPKKNYKRDNLKLGCEAIKVLSINGDLPHYNKKSIYDIIKGCNIKGRLERIDNVIVDGAHNPQGIEALVDSIDNASNKIFIIGISKNKNIPEMISVLKEAGIKKVYFTNNRNNELMNPYDLKKEYENFFKSRVIDFDKIKSFINTSNKQFVITGSLYLAGDYFKYIKEH